MQNAKIEKYNILNKQIIEFLDEDDPVITALSNIVAAIKFTFLDVSWVGFYILLDQNLYLGPFQGKVACSRIPMGKGVCGSSALENNTIIVEDVHKFPGHIVCDAESNSEIVIPISTGSDIWGVLDLDSKNFSNFNETDANELEKICKLISNKISNSKSILSL